MALFLESLGDERSEFFKEICIKIADYLVQRGFNFPTEGAVRQDKDREYEDGSISCTALSVLYVCKKIKYKQIYVDFAEKILTLHNAWTIYTPDARMYQSSFRWWETIWEGEDLSTKYTLAHSYPKHCDNSLSRYVWARYDATWQDTVAIVYCKNAVIGINIVNSDGVWIFNDNVKNLIVGSLPKDYVVKINAQGIENIYSKKVFSKTEGDGMTIIRIN